MGLFKKVEYLREILSIRRKGTSSIGEVHNKLLLLKEENERLRQNQVTVTEVEKLLDENKKLKQELQKLKPEFDIETLSQDNAPSFHQDSPLNSGNVEIDYNEFKSGLLSQNPPRSKFNSSKVLQL